MISPKRPRSGEAPTTGDLLRASAARRHRPRLGRRLPPRAWRSAEVAPVHVCGPYQSGAKPAESPPKSSIKTLTRLGNCLYYAAGRCQYVIVWNQNQSDPRALSRVISF